MVNGAEKSPAGTSTDAGRLAAGELLDIVTSAPPGGAAPVSITLPPDSAPPLAVDGTNTDSSEGGSTVRLPLAETPFNVAVIVTGAGASTWAAVSGNCTSPAEPGTASVAGTGAAAGLELTSASVAPAADTAAES